MKLQEFEPPIETRGDFARFLRKLATDYEQNPDAWEPSDVGDLLHRMALYAGKPIEGFHANQRPGVSPDDASWQTFADILSGARVYE